MRPAIATADINVRCTCGYRRFRETVRTVPEVVDRWVHYTPSEGSSGFGAVPFGTGFGAGDASLWGLFSMEIERPKRFLHCESCGRMRSAVPTGGFGIFGSYLASGYVYVVVSDVAVITCARVRFTQGDEQHLVEVTPYLGLPLPVLMEELPEETSDEVPSGELARVLRAAPPSGLAGVYDVALLDICLNAQTPLFSATFNT
jgi:hypothetical protein